MRAQAKSVLIEPLGDGSLLLASSFVAFQPSEGRMKKC